MRRAASVRAVGVLNAAAIALDKLTPMLRQYVELKSARPDVVLMMRVGDFHEAYGEDAETK